MALKFDPRTVSENLQKLVSQGIGRVRGGVPEFNTDDVRRHAILTQQSSPLTIPNPLADQANPNAFKFDQLDNPESTGIEKINIRIGELEAKKFETKSRLLQEIDRDTEVAGAKAKLGGLQIQRQFSFSRPEVINQIDKEITAAQKELAQAEDNAVGRLTRQFEIEAATFDAEIARLKARQENLVKRQAAGQADKTDFPRRTIEAVKSGHGFETDEDANKFLKTAPPNVRGMWGIVATKTSGEQLEYWNPNIDAGDRSAYDRYLLDLAPPDEKAQVLENIKHTKLRMQQARAAAEQNIQNRIKKGGPEGLLLAKDTDARAVQTQLEFDNIMRQGNQRSFEERTIGSTAESIRPEWYDDPAMYNLAVELHNKIPKDARSLEEGMTVALTEMNLPTSVKSMLIAEYLAERVTSYNSTNKFTGTHVARQTARDLTEAVTLRMMNVEQVQRSSEQLRQGLMRRGPLGLGQGEFTPTENFNARIGRGGFVERSEARKVAQQQQIDNNIAKLTQKIEQFGPNALTDREVLFMRAQTGQEIRPLASDTSAGSRSGLGNSLRRMLGVQGEDTTPFGNGGSTTPGIRG